MFLLDYDKLMRIHSTRSINNIIQHFHKKDIHLFKPVLYIPLPEAASKHISQCKSCLNDNKQLYKK